MDHLNKQYPLLFTYVIAFQSFVYCIVILFIVVYSIYSARKHTIDGRLFSLSLILYIMLFLTCIVYGFFRVTLEFDVPSFIHPDSFCIVSYTASISLYGFSKFIMYILFLYRLHIISRDTIFEINKQALYKIAVCLAIITLILTILWLYIVFPSIHYFPDDPVSICALDLVTNHSHPSSILLAIGVADNIVALSILALFVYKLSQIISMSNMDDNRHLSTSSAQSLTSALTKLLRKQTILVSIALLSSCFVFYVTRLFSYKWTMIAIPFDCFINAIATFLTFKWANAIWLCCCVKLMFCNFCQCFSCCNCEDIILRLALSVSKKSRSSRSLTIYRLNNDNDHNSKVMNVCNEETDNKIDEQQHETVQLTTTTQNTSKPSDYSMMNEMKIAQEADSGNIKGHATRFTFGGGITRGHESSTADTPLMSDNNQMQSNITLLSPSFDTFDMDDSEIINQMNLELTHTDRSHDVLQSVPSSIISPETNHSLAL